MNYKVAALAAVSVVSGGTWLALRDDPSPQKVCCVRYPDHTPANKPLCSLQGYIGLFTDSPDECHDGAVTPGTRVTLAVVNKIRGGIGDSNLDADVDIGDFIDFVGCLESTEPDQYPWLCLCPFDYNFDGKVDLSDFAEFQVAFGTGNTSWKAGE